MVVERFFCINEYISEELCSLLKVQIVGFQVLCTKQMTHFLFSLVSHLSVILLFLCDAFNQAGWSE